MEFRTSVAQSKALEACNRLESCLVSLPKLISSSKPRVYILYCFSYFILIFFVQDEIAKELEKIYFEFANVKACSRKLYETAEAVKQEVKQASTQSSNVEIQLQNVLYEKDYYIREIEKTRAEQYVSVTPIFFV